MFRSHRRTNIAVAALIISLFALSSCGSSDASRTRNAELDSRTCAEGGECAVGDVGPGGGVVFYDAGSDLAWGRYLEAANLYWGDGLPAQLKSSNYPKHNGEMSGRLNEGSNKPNAPYSASNVAIGDGKSAWDAVKNFRCNLCITNILAEYNTGVTSDWYLPNKGELTALFNSKVRKINFSDYWTSTGTASDPKRLVKMSINHSAQVADFSDKYQVEAWWFIPVRAFSATPVAVPETTVVEVSSSSTTESAPEATSEVSSLSQTKGVLQPVTNVKTNFSRDDMTVTFDLQTEGLAPEGHFVRMEWSYGKNDALLTGQQSLCTILIPSWARGQTVTVSVRSYSNATSPSQIADTEKIVVEIPAKEIKSETTQPTIPAAPEQQFDFIGDLNDPIITLPNEDVSNEINSNEIVQIVESQLPEMDVKKIEIQVEIPNNPTEEKFIDVSKDEMTTVNIPAEANQISIRITGSDGEVVTQTKLIDRVTASGTITAPSGGDTSSLTSSTTTVVSKNQEISDTTVATIQDRSPETSSEEPAESSDGLPVYWILIGVVISLGIVVVIRQRRQ